MSMCIWIIQVILDTLYLLEHTHNCGEYVGEMWLVTYMYGLLEKNGSSSLCVYKYAISAKCSRINWESIFLFLG